MNLPDTNRLLWDALTGKAKVVLKHGASVPAQGLWGRMIIKDRYGYPLDIITNDEEIFIAHVSDVAFAYVDAVKAKRAKRRKREGGK